MRYDLGSEATLGVLLLLSYFLHIVSRYPALTAGLATFSQTGRDQGVLGCHLLSPLSFPGYLSCSRSPLQPMAGVTAETARGMGSNPSAPVPEQ